MKNGVIFFGPLFTSALTPSWKTVRPPMPEPARTPIFVLSSLPSASSSRPASSSALLPDTSAYWRQSSMRRAFFLSTKPSLSKSRICAANLVGKSVDVEAVDHPHAGGARQELVVELVVVVAEHRDRPMPVITMRFFGIRLAGHGGGPPSDARGARGDALRAGDATRRGATAWRAPRTAEEATAAIVSSERF